jgi:histidyl-tRNA synthetase
LRGYHYHNGVVFAAYCDGYPAAIALGGRYDGAGKAFGRARPATGFSMDLREVARLVPAGKSVGAVLAPHIGKDARLAAHVAALREQGEIVVELLPVKPPAKVRFATASWFWLANTGLLKQYKRIRKWPRMSSWWAPSGATRGRARSSIGSPTTPGRGAFPGRP